MLSYQHGFHAGNLADVHKHSLLAWMLDYLVQKDKPLSYLETHAGRGIYDLGGAQAFKTGEAAQGIERAAQWFAPSHPYRRVLDALRHRMGAHFYPGSPEIAASLLRPQDSLTLAELHPQEHAALRRAMGRRAWVCHQDGAQMALSRCPPTPRRGLLLIDPSYEVKTEYETIGQLVAKLHRKWPVGIIAVWYPLLREAPHQALLQHLPPEHTVHEVRFAPARPGHGMHGSGLAVLNAPWGVDTQTAWLDKQFAALTPPA